MTINRSFALSAVTFCMMLGTAMAAAPAAAPAPVAPGASIIDDPAKIAAARAFIVLAHPRTDPKNVADMLDKTMPRMIAAAKKRDPNLDEKAFEHDTRERRLDNANKLLDTQSKVVARHFTLDDFKALMAFYSSPVGRKLTDETPKIQMELLHIQRVENAGPNGQNRVLVPLKVK